MKIQVIRKIFIVAAIISGLTVMSSSILLLAKDVIGFDFTGVSKEGCIPYNVFISKDSSSEYSVSISWDTKKECVGFIQYGRKSDDLDMVSVDLVNSVKSKNHTVKLEKLLTTERYYFLINSDNQAFGISGVPLEFVIADL